MKFLTHEEILDKHIGKKGTPKREAFDKDVEDALNASQSLANIEGPKT